jgi:hypothetical protein
VTQLIETVTKRQPLPVERITQPAKGEWRSEDQIPKVRTRSGFSMIWYFVMILVFAKKVLRCQTNPMARRIAAKSACKRMRHSLSALRKENTQRE